MLDSNFYIWYHLHHKFSGFRGYLLIWNTLANYLGIVYNQKNKINHYQPLP